MIGKHQRPGCIRVHRLHEGVADLYREIEASQRMMVLLGDDEVLDIRIPSQRRCAIIATPCPRRKDGAAHASQTCMKDRARGNAPGRMSLTPGGTQGRKIIATPPCCIVSAPS